MDYSSGKCPPAIRTKSVNIANHKVCIIKAELGPANPRSPEPIFWLKKAVKWNVPEAAARTMLCHNCRYYWKTKFIDDCMTKYPQATAPDMDPSWVATNDEGGYCQEWEITCTATRTCNDWEPGGPITDAKAKAGDYENED